VTEIIFAVLFVSLMGLTRCYKTTVFLHLLDSYGETVNKRQQTLWCFNRVHRNHIITAPLTLPKITSVENARETWSAALIIMHECKLSRPIVTEKKR